MFKVFLIRSGSYLDFCLILESKFSHGMVGTTAAPKAFLLRWGASPPEPPTLVVAETTHAGIHARKMAVAHACPMG